jgi:enoyl-CoA hydratase/carnithine racemase
LSSAEPRFVTVSKEDHIATVTLDRAGALNALSGAMAEEMAGVFTEIAAQSDIWAVVLRAAGDKAFCVGADLKERASFSLEDFYSNRKQIWGLFQSLRAVPQPVIAGAFGYALGGGFELLLSCDIVVAAEGTVMGLPEVRVGLLPAGGGTQLLPRKVGVAHAKELIFTGRRFTAEEALAMGLVAQVVARAELDDETRAVALDICKSSPVAVRAAKRSIDAGFGVDIDQAIEIEHRAWRSVIGSEDRGEGIAAFNAKRDPRWKNR